MIISYPILSAIIGSTLRFRGDSCPSLNIAHIEHWPGLEREPFSFKSGKWTLRGYKYHQKGIKPKALIILYHGIATGHYGYMNMIAYFAKLGYLVYAYDQKASLLSEGNYIFNLSEAAKAQEPFFKWLGEDKESQGLKRYVVGHSWGGYSAEISLRYEVDKIVSIAGFDSPVNYYKGVAPFARFFAWEMYLYQFLHYGKHGNVSGLKLMKRTDKPVLYIQGDQDKIVDYQRHGKVFQEALKDHKNVEFYIRKGSNHNPYWSHKAEEYYIALQKDSVNGPLAYSRKADAKIDDELLFSLDEGVMKVIVEFLER